MILRRIFVTVGTTQFQQLTDTIQNDEILQHLQRIQCDTLIIQHGSASTIPVEFKEHCRSAYGIRVDSYDYKPNISDDINGSDLVISHAGAGSCTEILAAKKPLIVVVNDQLMDNHQTELAHQLSLDGHLLYCFPHTLNKILATLDETIPCLKKYEEDSDAIPKLLNHLDGLVGFR